QIEVAVGDRLVERLEVEGLRRDQVACGAVVATGNEGLRVHLEREPRVERVVQARFHAERGLLERRVHVAATERRRVGGVVHGRNVLRVDGRAAVARLDRQVPAGRDLE